MVRGSVLSLMNIHYTGKNRRYLSLNVHRRGGIRWNVGLVRVWTSQSAETLKEIMEMRLADFKLSWDHIIAATTDGVSATIKLRKHVFM